MKVSSWEEATASSVGAEVSALTIGVFDGVHKGHQELVRRVVAGGLRPVAVTFTAHPKLVTAPERFGGSLQTLDQKLSSLEALGASLCVLIDFSGDFSKLTGNEFVSTLVRSCGARYFAVGNDFRCGYRMMTDARAMRQIAAELGAEVDIVEPVAVDGVRVSSSVIRSFLREGRTDRALAMLGRPYTLDLRAVEADRDASTLVVRPSPRGYVLPREGSYEGRLVRPGAALRVALRVADGSIRAEPAVGDAADRRLQAEDWAALEFHSPH